MYVCMCVWGCVGVVAPGNMLRAVAPATIRSIAAGSRQNSRVLIQWRGFAGHNKFSKIKHKKAANDKARSKLFSKLGNQLKVALRDAGGDKSSVLVQTAVLRARKAGMPKQNIDRALYVANSKDLSLYENVVYEGTGPKGVSVIVETITNNRQRTSPAMRHIFTKYGGSLGSGGSAKWAFEEVGKVVVGVAEGDSVEDIVDAGIEVGVVDFDDSAVVEGELELFCEPSDIGRIQSVFRGKHETAVEIIYRPVNFIQIKGNGDSSAEDDLLAMIEAFDEDDDVQKVTTNANL